MEARELLNKINVQKVLLALVVVLIIISLRLVPHVPNFIPIGAIAMFGGLYLSKKVAFGLTFSSLLISDVILGFYDSIVFVYLGFAAYILIGQYFRSNKNIANILISTLIGSISFFFISNFGVWLVSDLYGKTFSGVINCFYMALPFFKNSLMADYFYLLSFIAIYDVAINRLSSFKRILIYK